MYQMYEIYEMYQCDIYQVHLQKEQFVHQFFVRATMNALSNQKRQFVLENFFLISQNF